MKSIYYYETEIGKVSIVDDGSSITNLYFGEVALSQDVQINESKLIKKAVGELREYFSAKRKEFDIPLAPRGTDFQKKVWIALQNIPYGETRSYGEIAKSIGNPKACRAVGMANNKNPLPIFIPCHRVIGADGSMVGYGGGLKIKKYLLEIEKSY